MHNDVGAASYCVAQRQRAAKAQGMQSGPGNCPALTIVCEGDVLKRLAPIRSR